ncbi:hypothetical protein G7B40_038940 [Aetokthonos hydrillicola Thurmond2011]|jgi:hypothetical protein|uniref:Uncharacterized protein n=1 Tax=Aetokthonos hydrillicola Thurmond2011 TaxID=2712845 RepID=A0AAP5MDE9_9CYAN|nr:hypothetical protein [Aetokthonos hydrillicola]MBW4591209.1 hypothetical protein [Aetokthonos hydrillicola CCALA 1050]MDR9900482.1 hypothetical protein [Aetokthonos hydrillicola Thurmond2011]
MDIDITSGIAEKAIELVEKVIDETNKFNEEAQVANDISQLQQKVIEILNKVPGMTSAHSRDFKRATPVFKLKDGTVVKIYKNPVFIEHIFLANPDRELVFSGFVGLIDTKGLTEAIENIKREFGV